VLTRGHNVTTATGGTHHCDGTNNHSNPLPGPTCTSALDDASRRHGFGWDGAFFPEFDDFLVSTIGGESSTNTQFWALLLNFQFTQVGGCQQEVKALDHVLFAFDGFSKAHFLKLEGPHVAQKGQSVVYTVTDGMTGLPVAGAAVNDGTSDANGHVSVSFGKAGLNGIKATKSDSVRSNQLNVNVTP